MDEPQPRIRVLLVDNDPLVLKATKALLSDDFIVTPCPNAHAAMHDLRSTPEDFDVVCTAYGMPWVNGLDLLEQVEFENIEVGRVLLAGHVEPCTLARAEGWSIPLSVMSIPYSSEELTQTVRRMGRIAREHRSDAPRRPHLSEPALCLASPGANCGPLPG